MNKFWISLSEKITANTVIVFLITVFSVWAYARKEISMTHAMLFILFGSLTAISFYWFFHYLSLGNDAIGIQRSAPSIDGSISGWRLTTTFTLLLVSFVFAAATLLVFADARVHGNTTAATANKAADNTSANTPAKKNELTVSTDSGNH